MRGCPVRKRRVDGGVVQGAAQGTGGALRKVADIAVTVSMAALMTAGLGLAASRAQAQAGLERLAGSPQDPKGQRLLVEADELIYDNDRNTVTARGKAQLSYGTRTLQADRVRYDRGTSRVFAEGNVRLTDETGPLSRATGWS